MSNPDQVISIRRATTGDITLLSVLATTTFYEAYFAQDNSSDLSTYISEVFGPAEILGQLADPSAMFFILSVDGAAVGYAKMLAGSTDPSITTRETIELKRIYILERFWGKGLGDDLLKHCLDTARKQGHKSVWLGVWEKNARAQAFYRKHGFVAKGKLEFPYGDSVGINLVLEKTI